MLTMSIFLRRSVHISCVRRLCQPSTKPVDKSLLSKLRKKTGISFMNCKKALEKFQNDLDQAEKWLLDEAQKEGWAKATKLQGRPMSQGLIGLIADNNTATMIEVNCETDFVAKNVKFQGLVANLTGQCQQYFNSATQNKISLSQADLSQLVSPESGKPLADIVALEVGNIGENMSLRRAIYQQAEPGSLLASYVHASGTALKHDNCLLGKYAAFVEFRQVNNIAEESELSLDEIGQKLCQHVIGLNPQIVGSLDDVTDAYDDVIGTDDVASINIAGNRESMATDGGNEGDESMVHPDDVQEDMDAKPQRTRDDEKRLLFQEFLLDESILVKDFLQENSVEIIDFVRFECGEDLAVESDESSERGSGVVDLQSVL